jgi:hypothetical protein
VYPTPPKKKKKFISYIYITSKYFFFKKKIKIKKIYYPRINTLEARDDRKVTDTKQNDSADSEQCHCDFPVDKIRRTWYISNLL